MSDLSPETDKLLELARGASALSDVRRAQIKAGLLSQIAAGGALSAAASHATWGKAAWLSSPLVKGISVLALLSAVGVGVYAGVRTPNQAVSTTPSAVSVLVGAQRPSLVPAHSPSEVGAIPKTNSSTPSAGEPNALDPGIGTPRVASQAPEAVAVTLPGAVAPVSPSGSKAPANVARATPASEPTSSVAPATADTLAEETSLLRGADQALRAGNAQRALTLLDEHAARYPHGVLEPERSAERMIARCKLAQVDAKTAQGYLAAHSNSPFAARLQDACRSASR